MFVVRDLVDAGGRLDVVLVETEWVRVLVNLVEEQAWRRGVGRAR